MRQTTSSAFNTALTVGSEREGKVRPIKDVESLGKVKIDSVLQSNGLTFKMPTNGSSVVARQHKKHFFDKTEYVSGNESMICYWNSGSDYIDPNNSWLQFELELDLEIKAWPVGNVTPDQNDFGTAPGATARNTFTYTNTDFVGLTFSGALQEHDNLDRRISYSATKLYSNYKDKNTKGRGLATNVLKEVRIRARSGHEIEHQEHLNQRVDAEYQYKYDPDYINSVLTNAGHGQTFFAPGSTVYDSTAPTTAVPITGQTTFSDLGGKIWKQTVPVAIPLSCLAGFFEGPTHNKLIPPQLASGLKVEFTLEKAHMAFCFAIGTSVPVYQLQQLLQADDTNAPGMNLAYKIKNPAFVLDSILMADSVTRKMNKICAMNSLEYYFHTHDVSEKPTETSKMNIDSRKAVSRALSACVIVQPRRFATEEIFFPNFKAECVFPVMECQMRIGSQYYPNEVIKLVSEAYMNAIWKCDKLDEPMKDSTTITIHDFKTGGMGQSSITLERSNVLPLSGVPMNNSRTLGVNLSLNLLGGLVGSGADDKFNERRVYLFLKYTKLVRAFLDNVVIRE
jgi:hypothetical protein